MTKVSRLFGTGLAIFTLGVAMLCTPLSATAHHRGWHTGGPPTTSAPEIDPGMVRGTIVVLAGGVMMLLGRRRRS